MDNNVIEQDEDGDISPFIIQATCAQLKLLDEVTAKRVEKLKREHGLVLLADRDALVYECQKLLQIIANMYQIAGVHDLPEHILDVLADPESTTEEQIDAMLPYRLEG